MSLSDLASLGSFVSGVAVLASLVFLFFQMRQMTEQVRQSEKNQQAAIRQARSTRSVEMNLAASDPSVADAITAGAQGREDVSETAFRQFFHWMRANFMGWEDAFYQHEDGLFSDSAFNAY